MTEREEILAAAKRTGDPFLTRMAQDATPFLTPLLWEEALKIAREKVPA